MNDTERHMQFVIREKLQGYSIGQTKCRAALLMELLHEMKELKEELDNGKPGLFVLSLTSSSESPQ